jgi:Nuclease-related domain
MRPDNDRWVEVTPTRFAHERAGLEYVRAALPDAEPYRAWSNLEIITDRGRSLEVDLLVIGPAGLYLVELKAWGGRIGGDRYIWTMRGDRVITENNPWRLANEKARVLKSLLTEELALAPGPHRAHPPPGRAGAPRSSACGHGRQYARTSLGGPGVVVPRVACTRTLWAP